MSQTRMDPIYGDEVREKAVVKQLCGLLSHADIILASAAASAIASFYAPEDSCVHIWPVVARHIRDVGAVFGKPAAVAQMVATGPPFAVGRLTILAASVVTTYGNRRHDTIAAALLPGLMPALGLACKYREVKYSICIVNCAELALAAAQLQPAAGTAAAEQLSSPRLQQQALYLAMAAQSCMNRMLDTAQACDEAGKTRVHQLAALLAIATSTAMGTLHQLTRRRHSCSGAQADGMLGIFGRALSHLVASAGRADPESGAVVAGCCQMLWLCTGYLLPVAVEHGSSSLVKAVVTACIQVLSHGAQEAVCADRDTRAILLVAARVLEVAGRTATEPFTIGHVAIPRALLVNRVLPLLNSGRASSLQGGTEWPLAHAWPPVGSKHDYSKQQVSRDLDVTVLLADELVRILAAFVQNAFTAPLPQEPRLPSGTVPGGFGLLSLVNVVYARVAEAFGAFMLGHDSGKPRRLGMDKCIRLPGEAHPACPIAAERAVAAAALRIVEACLAAAAASEQQLRQPLQAVDREHELCSMRAHLPGNASQAAAVGLVHLSLELREFGATGDAEHVDALWRRLRPLLKALAGGDHGHATAAQLLQNVGGCFSSAVWKIVPAAAHGRADIVAGLCDLLERLLRREPLPAEHLHSSGWPQLWREALRDLRSQAGPQLLAEVEPTIRRVSDALQRAVDMTQPPEAGQRQQQQEQRRQRQRQQRQQKNSAAQQQQPAADTAAAAEAADRMAALLLQEEAAEQQQAARATRKKKRSHIATGDVSAIGGPNAIAFGAAHAAASDTAGVGPAGSAAHLQPAANNAAGSAAVAGAAQQPEADAAAAASEPAPDADAWQLCPLTKVVMVDPALLPADGQSYERAAVTEWLHQHGTSPLTGQPADAATLMPNFALRSLLQALARRPYSTCC